MKILFCIRILYVFLQTSLGLLTPCYKTCSIHFRLWRLYQLSRYLQTTCGYCMYYSISFCKDPCLLWVCGAVSVTSRSWRNAFLAVVPTSTSCCSICCRWTAAPVAAIAKTTYCCYCFCVCLATLAATISTVLRIPHCTNLCLVIVVAANAAACGQYQLSYFIRKSICIFYLCDRILCFRYFHVLLSTCRWSLCFFC